MHRQLVIKNHLSEIPHLAEFMEALGREMHLPEVLAMRLNLVLEEAVSNIIMYAYPEKRTDHIFIDIEKKGQAMIFQLSDKGIAFDPTQVKEADISLTADKRPIGGLGIYIIRNIMDEVSYERHGDTNRFTMVKWLSTDTDS